MPADELTGELSHEKAGASVMAARLALRRGRKDEARAKLREAFAIDPTDCGALELLGDIFLEEGEQEKAIAVFERGLKYHPRHHAFEEKLALAHLDLEEMERDRLLRERVLQQGDVEKWQDRKPARALGLSLLIPGMGQFYNEENERGAAFFMAWLLAFIAWYWPLHVGFNLLKSDAGAARLTFGNAVARLNGFWQAWFYVMLVAFVLIYCAAAIDAWRRAEALNAARRRAIGLE